MFRQDTLIPMIGLCPLSGKTEAGNEMATTRYRHTAPVNRKIFWPFFIVIYMVLAVPLTCDIWQGTLGTTIDMNGRIMLSVLVLCVICPLFSSGSIFALLSMSRGMRVQPLSDLFSLPENLPAARNVTSRSMMAMRLQTVCLVMQVAAMSVLTVFPFLLLFTVLQRLNE